MNLPTLWLFIFLHAALFRFEATAISFKLFMLDIYCQIFEVSINIPIFPLHRFSQGNSYILVPRFFKVIEQQEREALYLVVLIIIVI